MDVYQCPDSPNDYFNGMINKIVALLTMRLIIDVIITILMIAMVVLHVFMVTSSCDYQYDCAYVEPNKNLSKHDAAVGVQGMIYTVRKCA